MSKQKTAQKRVRAHKATQEAEIPSFCDGVKALPFVSGEPGPTWQWWTVKPKLLWEEDMKTGRAFGDLAVHCIRESNTNVLLGNIAMDMGNRTGVSGIEAGFFEAITKALKGMSHA